MEFILLDDLLDNKNICDITIDIEKDNNFDDIDLKECHNLYQFNNKQIKFIGKYSNISDLEKTIKLHTFSFKNHECQLVSYLLTDKDIINSDISHNIDILGLIILDNKTNKPKLSIILSYCKTDEKPIYETIINKTNIEGYYNYTSQINIDNITKHRILKSNLLDIPNNDLILYSFIELLSKDEFTDLFE
jgi:hypothetical protein